MRSRSLWLLLSLVACGKSGAPAAGTPAAADSLGKDSVGAVAPGKFQHEAKKAPVIDTGTVAPPQSLVRETYGYSFTSASRDPFRPLTNIAVEGPEFPDLRLVGLIYNHTDPKQSLATFVDIGNKKRYTVRPGERIGRLLFVSVDSAGTAILRVNDFGTVREQPYTLRKEDGN